MRREEDGARKAGKSELEDRRPKTHRESVVVAPTDGRTDGRHKQRISSSVYSPCIVHARERARGPLCDDIGYRAEDGHRRLRSARTAMIVTRRVRCEGVFISLTHIHARGGNPHRSKRIET